jgi:hypothetical protein
MKKVIFTLLITCVLSAMALAQASFSMTPNPANCSAPPDLFDVPAYSKIKNKTNKPINMRWNRRIIQLPQGATCAVCDLTACYDASVSTADFTLDANAEGEISVHFYNNEEVPGMGIVNLKMTNLAVPADTVTVVFTYNAKLSAEERELANRVIVAPNPVKDFVQLQNADDLVVAVRILAQDGREIAYLQATPDQRYDLAHLPTGLYYLTMESKKGQLLRAVEIKKL